ncbi:DNA alkylation repair protein [Flavobacterium sp.]|uniref:DNA alkylation repair protein n=1 Tax=Flavobacterium sp. TaxID=239 RepID=UPI00286F67E3|nr:DNA alkylation repair protein [Flavobacterium sp.]
MNFITELENTFAANAKAENALPMAKYMKNLFPFFGIKTDERRAIFKSLCKKHQTEINSNVRAIGWELFLKKERELQYCGIEILLKNLKNNYQVEDIIWIEQLLTTNSWWDSVDTISKFILGDYLQQFLNEIPTVIKRFSTAENMWLNRSVILFQLGYKSKTDFKLLQSLCIQHSHSNEFFIRKAIGWALREYAKTDPEAVREFVLQSNLKPLSKKEALKNI